MKALVKTSCAVWCVVYVTLEHWFEHMKQAENKFLLKLHEAEFMTTGPVAQLDSLNIDLEFICSFARLKPLKIECKHHGKAGECEVFKNLRRSILKPKSYVMWRLFNAVMCGISWFNATLHHAIVNPRVLCRSQWCVSCVIITNKKQIGLLVTDTIHYSELVVGEWVCNMTKPRCFWSHVLNTTRLIRTNCFWWECLTWVFFKQFMNS